MNQGRWERLDALRGLAMLWMAAFHFCFDLSYFGILQANFLVDRFWTVQRSAIVSLFLFVAGLSLGAAQAQQQTARRFWLRWAQVAACAVVVSLASWLAFGERFISFGVLHGMAVMLVLLRYGAPGPFGLVVLGAVALVLPQVLSDPWFDSRWTNPIGLVTHKPPTEDYVPILPWIGVMAWGLATCVWLRDNKSQVLSDPLPAMLKPLAGLGRWSLSFYMLHQPVLLSLLWLAGARPPGMR